jgi:C4-dicarboxylate transporter, DctM subunit
MTMAPTVLILAILLLLALTIPVAVSVGLVGMLAILLDSRMSLLAVPQQLFIGIDKYPLAAIPFFILAGNLMESGGISRRLIDFRGAWR